MMPISRKAVINAQMMQALAPEMKKIKEKYPDNMEKQGLAQRELFRRFKYNPFSGCLIVFLQLPIFIGLYRGLSVDFELRDQPLIPGMSWCSNMAGPDQLWNWSNYLPGFIGSETGWLGPYFNVLPLVTIVLFILQQKIFMPPPTDEQQAIMQKMMSYMMIFMGFLFFKVPAGLCIYFITSSIWGLIERAVIPKPQLSQEVLDSISRDSDNLTSVVAKPLAAEGKTQLDEKSRQELRDRDKERQKRLKDKRKD
jgi:YidC/Oxa1 family membrane protein insertase